MPEQTKRELQNSSSTMHCCFDLLAIGFMSASVPGTHLKSLESLTNSQPQYETDDRLTEHVVIHVCNWINLGRIAVGDDSQAGWFSEGSRPLIAKYYQERALADGQVICGVSPLLSST